MKKILTLIAIVMVAITVQAQVPIKLSTQVVDRHGKHCWVHILQKGQTVFSIARAYGVKEYEAITSKDIHHLEIGDTVWVPCLDPNQPVTVGKSAQNEKSVESRVETPKETTVKKSQSSKPSTKPIVDESKDEEAENHYIKVEPGQTLYGISRTYEVTIEDLLALNPDVNQNGLKSGQMLRLPQNAKFKSSAKSVSSKKVETEEVKSTDKNMTVKVRPRIDKEKVYVSVMIPLHLDKLNEISTTKFDIEQRGRTSYSSFEFIQFYEGIQMGLEKLKGMGYQVVLNVVDVPNANPVDVEQAFKSHNVANSDVLIALLTREPFNKAAELARENNLFIINPMSTRSEILSNPYVVKCASSQSAKIKAILDNIKADYPNAHLTVLHSNHRSEKGVYDEVLSQLKERGDIAYTMFDWGSSSRLNSTLNKNGSNVVLNIYNQGRSRNRIQVGNMLNRLSAMKAKPVVLYSLDDYTQEYNDIDFHQLQHVSYHTFNLNYDEDDEEQKAFVEAYREMYKTEPMGQYAALGHDIIIYFVNGLHKKGDDFWKNPASGNPMQMLIPIRLRQSQPGYGYENQTAIIYRLGNYKFERVNQNR